MDARSVWKPPNLLFVGPKYKHAIIAGVIGMTDVIAGASKVK